MATTTDRWWLVRAMRFGLWPPGPPLPDVSRYFQRRAGPSLARALLGAPVAYCVREGRMVHPGRAALAEHTVGRVDDAWCAGDSVYAAMSIAAAHLHLGLLKMEREGRVQRAGLSMSSYCNEWRERRVFGRRVLAIMSVDVVFSLDFVFPPGCKEAHVLRSVPSTPWVRPDVELRSRQKKRKEPAQA
jgi:hypothetical protein